MKPVLALTVPLIALALSGFRVATPQDIFFGYVSDLCGRSFEGRVVSADPADADFRGKRLIMTVADCSTDEIRIPFAVGEDRSRTWVLTDAGDTLKLRHDHRHADGTEDRLSQYGGETISAGSDNRQEFPVDAFSKALFTREDRAISNTNTWAMEVHPGQVFAYELRRENRHFRVEFDLARPIAETAQPSR
jgi:hypothetical protein